MPGTEIACTLRGAFAIGFFLDSRERRLALIIRTPSADELPALSDLCFRSKAVRGYDDAFMNACRAELSFGPRDLELTHVAVAEQDGRPAGVVQVGIDGGNAQLLKLFVEPEGLRKGTGKALLNWASRTARRMGARQMVIESDPDAAPFYRRMGARDTGTAPSGSIPGRSCRSLCSTSGDLLKPAIDERRRSSSPDPRHAAM